MALDVEIPVLTTTVEKNPTTYFRRAFDVTDPAQYNGLNVHLRYDDGAVVYLNGTELFRTANMPGGTITWATGRHASGPAAPARAAHRARRPGDTEEPARRAAEARAVEARGAPWTRISVRTTPTWRSPSART